MIEVRVSYPVVKVPVRGSSPLEGKFFTPVCSRDREQTTIKKFGS
jgi:hypothetical protein